MNLWILCFLNILSILVWFFFSWFAIFLYCSKWNTKFTGFHTSTPKSLNTIYPFTPTLLSSSKPNLQESSNLGFSWSGPILISSLFSQCQNSIRLLNFWKNELKGFFSLWGSDFWNRRFILVEAFLSFNSFCFLEIKVWIESPFLWFLVRWAKLNPFDWLFFLTISHTLIRLILQ